MKIEYGFIADLFTNQYQGGAELTTHALMESHPASSSVWAAQCKGITAEDIDRLAAESKLKNIETRLVFGNFAQLNPNIIPNVIVNFKYYVVEYDFKFCEFRSMEKHFASVGIECDCNESHRGKVIEQFYKKAQHVFFMSEKQREVYKDKFPEWDMENTSVLSSVFTKNEWRIIEDAKTLQKGVIRNNIWTFQRSQQWIKGSLDSEDKARELSDNKVVAIEGLGKLELLNLFSGCAGFVFLPKGADTCPRIVIEAKLMDCPIEMNDNVQHVSEPWFAHGTYDTIAAYLKERPAVFWNMVSGD